MDRNRRRRRCLLFRPPAWPEPDCSPRHTPAEAFTPHLVLWDCKHRPRTCRLFRQRVKQRDKTAGNSEGMIIVALRGPPEEAAPEETKTWKKGEEEINIWEHVWCKIKVLKRKSGRNKQEDLKWLVYKYEYYSIEINEIQEKKFWDLSS